ncbi:oligosaccharide flippase family protein [bacterium]|nr:oligosaccharide flippase family protein [bacterium]
MLSRLKKAIKNNKALVQNFSYLSILQIFNLLVPLITYPYLIRVLGKEIYGLVVFSQAVLGYLCLLINFGFSISATKFISINRNSNKKLNEIFSNIFILKGLIFLICVIFFSIGLNFISEDKDYKLLYYLTLYLCLYEWVFPVWFFQGIEKMKYITILNVVSRSVFLILVFILIKNKNDYLLYPIISGIGAILASVLALIIIFLKYKVRLIKPTFKSLKFYFIDSAPIFISNLSSRIFAGSNKVIIGSFLSMADVAYYDLAEKIVNLLRLPQAIMTQAIFPKTSMDRNVTFVKKILGISLIGNIFVYVLLFVFHKPIILLLAGENLLEASSVVMILALIAPLIVLTTTFGTQLLLAFGYNKEFSKVAVTSACFYLFIIILLYFTIGFTLVNITLSTVFTILFESYLLYKLCLKFKLI